MRGCEKKICAYVTENLEKNECQKIYFYAIIVMIWCEQPPWIERIEIRSLRSRHAQYE